MSLVEKANINTSLLEGQGPCTTPLDLALEYVRSRIERVLPMYVAAMAPHAIIMIWLIDAIIGERRSLISTYCWYLVACTIWRWIWLSRVQYDVQRDLEARLTRNFWKRLPQVLVVRLVSHFAITWGSFAVGIPSFYGLYTGSFAAPLLFESDEPTPARIRRMMSWINHSTKRLLRILLAMTVLACIVMVGVFVSQIVLSQTILPSLLGMDTVDLTVTLDSWSWRLRVFYFLFLVFDFFWTIAAVFVYYDSQSRRMATDLRARMQMIS